MNKTNLESDPETCTHFTAAEIEGIKTGMGKKATLILWESGKFTFQSGGRKGRVAVTKEYAVRFSDNSVTVVNLGRVRKMELDAYVNDISVRNEYGTAGAAPDSAKKKTPPHGFNPETIGGGEL